MRLLIQRVSEARAAIAGQIAGSIGPGLLVFIGIGKGDTAADADYLIGRLLGLRIFPDDAGKMNRTTAEAGGSLLVVSQFTLYGDCLRSRRPSFDSAMPAEMAEELYNYFVAAARTGPVPVEVGSFGASMEIHLVNQGPATFFLDSSKGPVKPST